MQHWSYVGSIAVLLACNACATSHPKVSAAPDYSTKDWPTAAPYQPATRAALGGSPPAATAAEAPAPTVQAASSFDSDADGWTVMGDAKNYHANADFSGSGGNPGGLITAKDDEQGGTVYFVAPAHYLGDRTRAYGQQLHFDLKTTTLAHPYKAYGVMLSGGGTTVVTLMPYDPAPANQWRSYAIALDTSVAWKVVPGVTINAESDLTAAPAASESDLRSVLAALNTLRIRAEYNAGPDSGSLDNVHFGE